MEPIRAASVQFEHRNGDPDYNRSVIRKFVEAASEKDVQIIAFPECCVTGYWFLRNLSRTELLELSESAETGPTAQFLLALSKKYSMTIGAGIVERANDGTLYNTYIVAMPDGSLARHRKLHTFISAHMASGSEYTVFDTPHGWRTGVLICYDNNLIENARITALKGADIILAPHQTGGCKSSDRHGMKAIDPERWRNRKQNPEAIREEFCGIKGREWLMRWLPSRAHDNGLFYIFSNGVGIDDDEVRTGNAMILDPYGRILRETCKAGDDMVVADLDPALLDNNSGRRWMSTRRPELYSPLTQPTGRERPVRKSRMEDNPNVET